MRDGAKGQNMQMGFLPDLLLLLEPRKTLLSLLKLVWPHLLSFSDTGARQTSLFANTHEGNSTGASRKAGQGAREEIAATH